MMAATGTTEAVAHAYYNQMPVNKTWIPASAHPDGKYVTTYNVKLASDYITLERLLNDTQLSDDRWDIYEIMPMPSGSYAYTVIFSKSEWVENDRAS